MAGRLPPLSLEQARLAGLAPGTHGRKRSGSGTDFWQFRPYQWGDPGGAIDWRQSARFQGPQIREREWQAPRDLFLWCDPSPSMDWASGRDLPTKRERAALLGLALAVAVLDGGEAAALLRPGARPGWGPARARTISAQFFAQEQEAQGVSGEDASGGGAGDGAEGEAGGGAGASPSLPAPLAPGVASYVVILSDFLDDLAPLAERLALLASRGAGGALVRVLDPAERDPPWRGGALFEGLEGEAPWKTRRAESLKQAYARRVAERGEAVKRLAAGNGWSLIEHDTSSSALVPLVALHRAAAAR